MVLLYLHFHCWHISMGFLSRRGELKRKILSLIFAWMTFFRISAIENEKERTREWVFRQKLLRTTLETAANVVIMTVPIRKSNQIKSRSNLEMWIHLVKCICSFSYFLVTLLFLSYSFNSETQWPTNSNFCIRKKKV